MLQDFMAENEHFFTETRTRAAGTAVYALLKWLKALVAACEEIEFLSVSSKKNMEFNTVALEKQDSRNAYDPFPVLIIFILFEIHKVFLNTFKVT